MLVKESPTKWSWPYRRNISTGKLSCRERGLLIRNELSFHRRPQRHDRRPGGWCSRCWPSGNSRRGRWLVVLGTRIVPYQWEMWARWERWRRSREYSTLLPKIRRTSLLLVRNRHHDSSLRSFWCRQLWCGCSNEIPHPRSHRKDFCRHSYRQKGEGVIPDSVSHRLKNGNEFTSQ